MPFIVGEYERLLAERGHFMMTPENAKFPHTSCGGLMILTRHIGPDASLTPAVFVCKKCGQSKAPYPLSPGQGVQPTPRGVDGFGGLGGRDGTPKNYGMHYSYGTAKGKPSNGDDNDGEWR